MEQFTEQLAAFASNVNSVVQKSVVNNFYITQLLGSEQSLGI